MIEDIEIYILFFESLSYQKVDFFSYYLLCKNHPIKQK